MTGAAVGNQHRIGLPDSLLHRHAVFYRALLDRTKGLEPIRVAVIHPVDHNALLGAVEAALAAGSTGYPET
jgi:hypothetical protein